MLDHNTEINSYIVFGARLVELYGLLGDCGQIAVMFHMFQVHHIALGQVLKIPFLNFRSLVTPVPQISFLLQKLLVLLGSCRLQVDSWGGVLAPIH